MVVFPPGETFHYSNFSMAVADAVIEAVTGGAFADYLHERVFAPLQMTHSTLGGSGSRPAVAQPYDAGGERHVDARFPRSSRQMQSSLMDLLKFAAFQLGTPMPAQRPVLGTDSIRLMKRQRTQAAGAHWALGFGSLDIGDERRWVLSSGNDIGVQSHLTLLPHAGLGVVVLSNGSGDHADELGIRIADAVVDGFAEAATAAIRAYEARTTTFTASREWAGAWAGRVAAPGGDLPLKLSVDPGGAIRVVLGEGPPVVVEDVKQRDGTLTGAFTGRLPLEETPEGEHRIELTLRTSGDTLTGFAVANFRSARGKFELPVPVVLRRER